MSMFDVISSSRRRFSPLQLSPALWLDASDSSTLYDATTGGTLVLADGSIARWEDKSGNARHVTQATLGYRPLRKTGIKNSKDVIRFDGADDLMLHSTASVWRFLHESDSSVFIVFRAGDIADPEALYALIGTSLTIINPGGTYYAHDTRSSSFRNNALVNVSGGDGIRILADSQDTIAGNQFGIFSCIGRPTNAVPANRSEIYANGGSAVSNNASTGNVFVGNPRHALAVGSAQNSSSVFAGFLLGDIAEILIFPTALSDTNRLAVQSYLNAKWAVY